MSESIKCDTAIWSGFVLSLYVYVVIAEYNYFMEKCLAGHEKRKPLVSERSEM